MAGLSAHTQRPNLPGASAAGAACAKAADLFPKVADLRIAIDGWMAGMYHRRPCLIRSSSGSAWVTPAFPMEC